MKMEFTLPELQYIVNVLEQRPYAEVAALLMNIKAQFDAAQAVTTGAVKLHSVDTAASST